MDRYSISETAKVTGLTKSLINLKIHNGEIIPDDGFIPAETVSRMLQEKKDYISLLEYAMLHSTESFNGEIVHDRDILFNEIESRLPSISITNYDELLIGSKKDSVFFKRSDVPALDEALESFFGQYGMSEEDKIGRLLSGTTLPNTPTYVRSFMKEFFTEQTVTPIVTEFVRLILSVPDILEFEDTDLKTVLDDKTPVGVKDLLVKFLLYVKRLAPVKYGDPAIKKKEKKSIGAYADSTYLKLAECFFNNEYIHDHHMIERALDNHLYAEMWLYLSLFYVCGWRAADVCRGWEYLNLKDKPDGYLGFHKDTLYDDLLNDRITDEQYKAACQFALGSIQVSGKIPSKTGASDPGPLTMVITDSLYTFYGLLTLIAEANMLRSGDGYMKAGRIPEYSNKVNLREFFGPEVSKILHGENIQTRRLNKSYLQGIEREARKEGIGGILAAAIASYGRNHKDLNTIAHYLRDHNLTGEDAATVLYFMAERGVFGFELYQTLITAFPDAMQNLPLADQNKIIDQMNISPLRIELNQANLMAELTVKDSFEHGDTDTALSMLKSMFELSQMRGHGKDHGIYCLKRAAGCACTHSEFDSCIANGCRELVFTKLGYIPLLNILREYKIKAENGDKKSEMVLTQVLIPRYQMIINQMIKEYQMNQADRDGLKLLTQEVLSGK